MVLLITFVNISARGPVLSIKSENITVGLNEEVNIRCTADKKMNISWLTVESDEKAFQESQSSTDLNYISDLTLTTATCRSVGYYYCIAGIEHVSTLRGKIENLHRLLDYGHASRIYLFVRGELFQYFYFCLRS